jgi:hypothetical protein
MDSHRTTHAGMETIDEQFTGMGIKVLGIGKGFHMTKLIKVSILVRNSKPDLLSCHFLILCCVPFQLPFYVSISSAAVITTYIPAYAGIASYSTKTQHTLNDKQVFTIDVRQAECKTESDIRLGRPTKQLARGVLLKDRATSVALS